MEYLGKAVAECGACLLLAVAYCFPSLCDTHSGTRQTLNQGWRPVHPILVSLLYGGSCGEGCVWLGQVHQRSIVCIRNSHEAPLISIEPL